MAEQSLNKTDRKILDHLYKDSKASQKLLSASLGISEPSLTKRKRDLEGKKIIKNYSVNIGYDKIGYDTHAITLVRLKVQRSEIVSQVIGLLKNINDAVEVYSVFGEWDIFVRWLSLNNAKVSEYVESISENENVGHTQTFTLTTEHKREHGPDLSHDAE